jgi:RND family efflux transporter MFP subunit
MKRFEGHKISKMAAAAVLLAAGPVLFALSGCDQSHAQNNSSSNKAAASNKPGGDALRIEVAIVERRDLVKTVEMPGTVEGIEMADLYAKVGGYLLKFVVDAKTNMSLDIGDTVTKGQELAWLHIPEMEKQLNQKQAVVSQAEAEIEQAQAVIDKAKADLKSSEASFDEAKTERDEKQAHLEFRRTDYVRIKRLVDSQSVRQELFDQVKYQRDAAEAAIQTVEARIRTADANRNAADAQVRKVQADYKTAQARLKAAQADADYVETMMEYSVIKAPFDGVVTKRFVHPGDFIQPAEGNSAAKPLLTVSRTDIVRVFLNIPMNDVQFLDRNDRAVLSRINVLPGMQIEGNVTRFASSLNVNSRLMRVEIDLPNPDGLLLPGYYGYVTVHLEELKNTPVIPSSSLLSDGDEVYVFVCENGRAHKRTVTTNYQDGTWVGVESGLQGGEQIVRAGGGQITDGQKVTAVISEK